MFNFVKLPELDFDLQSETTDSGRKYVTPTGNVWPSVTTVLSASGDKTALENWKKRIGEEEANKITKRSGRRGTKLHSLCEQYFLGELTDFKRSKLMPFDKMLFGQMKSYLDKYVNNIYCIEQALYSDKLRIAGRVDLIAEWKGELAVIDFKTSIHEKKEEYIQNYFIQCTTYSEMFEELTGRPINKIVVAIATEDQMPQIFEKEKHKYLSHLYNCIDNYWNK